jgi:hypothetical protein
MDVSSAGADRGMFDEVILPYYTETMRLLDDAHRFNGTVDDSIQRILDPNTVSQITSRITRYKISLKSRAKCVFYA